MLKRVLEFYGTVGVPILYAVGLWLIAYGEKAENPWWVQIIGLTAGIVGMGLWIASYLSLGSHFGVLPRQQQRSYRGVYSQMKHPMYTAITLVYGGLSLANNSVSGLIFTVLVLIPLLWYRAKKEEALLR